jgi:hypothetical protein
MICYTSESARFTNLILLGIVSFTMMASTPHFSFAGATTSTIAKSKDPKKDNSLGAIIAFVPRLLFVVILFAAGVLASMSLGGLLAFGLKSPMTWFSNPVRAFLLFGTTAGLGQFLVLSICHRLFFSTWSESPEFFASKIISFKIATLAFWSFVLFILNRADIGSAYLVMWWVVYYLLDIWIYWIFAMVSKDITESVVTLSTISIVLSIFPLHISLGASINALFFFVPTMGRFGATPSDLVISGLSALLWTLCTHAYWHVFLFVQSCRVRSVSPISTGWKSFLLLSVGLTAFGLILPVYTDLAPKRIVLQHTFDAGKSVMPHDSPALFIPELYPENSQGQIYFMGMDNTPTETYLHFQGHTGLAQLLSPLDALPVEDLDCMYPLAHNFVSSASVYPHAQAPPFVPVDLRIVSDEARVGSVRSIVIRVTTPKSTYGTMRIENSKLLNWSFTESEPLADSDGSYLIRFICGDDHPFEFSLDFKSDSSPLIRYVATYFTWPTPDMDRVISNIPIDAAIVAWTSVITRWTVEPLQ